MKTWNVGIDENLSVLIEGIGGKFLINKADLADVITDLQLAQNQIPRITFPKPAVVRRFNHLRVIK